MNDRRYGGSVTTELKDSAPAVLALLPGEIGADVPRRLVPPASRPGLFISGVRVSTRDEILAALMNHPTGLTYKEIAKRCPACECDEQVVGRMVGALRSENLLHADGFREGLQIYLPGPLAIEVHESPITLNTPRQPPQEYTMHKPTVLDRCLEALKQHGPCTQAQLARHAESTPGSVSTITGMLKARGVWKHQTQGKVPALYGLPGQKVPDALERGGELGKRSTSEKGHGPAAQSGSRNGSAETPGPDFHNVIEALEFARSVLKAKVEKIERAIEAVRALA